MPIFADSRAWKVCSSRVSKSKHHCASPPGIPKTLEPKIGWGIWGWFSKFQSCDFWVNQPLIFRTIFLASFFQLRLCKTCHHPLAQPQCGCVPASMLITSGCDQIAQPLVHSRLRSVAIRCFLKSWREEAPEMVDGWKTRSICLDCPANRCWFAAIEPSHVGTKRQWQPVVTFA